MCGIVGYLDVAGKRRKSLGQTILQMLTALDCRGPDSAGVALYNNPEKNHLIARIKLAEELPVDGQVKGVVNALKKQCRVLSKEKQGDLLKLVLNSSVEVATLIKIIEGAAEGIEVVSLGNSLEILKQVGAPSELEKTFHISSYSGSHAIGHTRLSTESRIDLSHSQPFWAHGSLDVATVHNGHITNYHILRRQYEQKRVKFYTENDSELLGIYLHDYLSQGLPLNKILEQSIQDLDGSFCYLVATADTLAFVKDSLSLKPLVVGEGEGYVAIATEEIALRKVFPDLKTVREPDAESVQLWRLNGIH